MEEVKKELSEENVKALTSISHSTKYIIHILSLIQSGKVSKKDRSRLCESLINKHILPMENIMLNLYIDANGLRDIVNNKENEQVV